MVDILEKWSRKQLEDEILKLWKFKREISEVDLYTIRSVINECDSLLECSNDYVKGWNENSNRIYEHIKSIFNNYKSRSQEDCDLIRK